MKIMENPIKMDDLGVPLFLETPIWLIVRRHRDIYHSSSREVGENLLHQLLEDNELIEGCSDMQYSLL